MILIRNGENGQGIEVYMTQRPDTMKFLPGFYVFPGGVMQPEDRDDQIHRLCVKQRLEVDLSYAVTAIRECFEEVGYLLADFVPHQETRPLSEIRTRLEAGQLQFREWVVEKQIHLQTDKIRYYGHRITPRTVSPRRFDTRYFLTVLPRSIELIPSEKEVARAAWMDPLYALQQAEKGIFKMVFPTKDALTDLARFDSAYDAFQNGQGVGTPRPHELA